MNHSDTITLAADRKAIRPLLYSYLTARGVDSDHARLDDDEINVMTSGFAQNILDTVKGRLELVDYPGTVTIEQDVHKLIYRFKVGNVKGRLILYSQGSIGFDMKHASPMQHGFIAVGYDHDGPDAAGTMKRGIDRWLKEVG